MKEKKPLDELQKALDKSIKLWGNRPRWSLNKEEWIDSTGEPISNEVAEYWFADFDKAFDEAFSQKGSLLSGSPDEKPHYFTVSEAREKLKESTEPRNVYPCGER